MNEQNPNAEIAETAEDSISASSADSAFPVFSGIG
jgi:hypothetical protein